MPVCMLLAFEFWRFSLDSGTTSGCKILDDKRQHLA